MRRAMVQWKAFVALSALGAALTGAGCSKGGSPDEGGKLKVALVVPGGYTINTVSYEVDSATHAVIKSGSIDVSGAGASISFALDLAPAVGDTITLTATSTTGIVFTGTSPPFNVVSGQTTLVSVILTNTLADAGAPVGQVDVTGTIVPANNAPVLTFLIVSPLQAAIGTPISVSVTASDSDAGDTLTYKWTAAPDGSFASAAAASTSYTGTTAGSKTLTVTVTDSHGATASSAVPVTIISLGTGGAPGTGGSPATGGSTGAAGAPATGGTTGAAGSPATGGTTGAAGSPATGGSTGAAGSSATGGTTGAAGSPATGGSTGAAGAPATGGTAGTTSTGGSNGSAALQTAELATGFDPNALTYTHSTDPDTGDQVPIGWGPTTLPSAAQQNAAAALIRAIAAGLPGSVRNSTNTANAVPGTPTSPSANVPNPLNGLLVLGQDPSSLISGANIGTDAATQALLTAYRNAAIADSAVPKAGTDPGGLTAIQAASLGTLGSYLAVEGSDPSSAVGLAVNIVTDAIQYGLVAQLQAY